VNRAEKLFSVRGQIVDWGTGRPVSGAVLELAVLTGTVVPVSAAPWMRESTGRAVDISDGKVDGDKFSFKVITESKQGAKAVVYEGTVEGDQLKGVMKFRGIGLTRPFHAKREN